MYKEISIEKTYQVKLFHSEANNCKNSGQSDYRTFSAPNEAVLRVKVETTDGEIFRGENCQICSEQAKVTYSIK